MDLVQKMRHHLAAISSSWDSFYESNTFLHKLRQHLPSRGLPKYLALAAFITTVASVSFLSLGMIRYRRDSHIWDIETTWRPGSAVQLSPRDMAANDTLGVSPTMHERAMSVQLTSGSSRSYSR